MKNVNARLILILTLLLGLSACYSEKPANGVVDMSAVPNKVAVVVPLEGLALDFGIQPIQSSTDLVLTLVNGGHFAATAIKEDSSKAMAAPFGFKGGTFPGTGGTCNSVLEIDATCTLVLTFSPVTDSTFTGSFNFTYINGAVKVPMTVALTGSTAADLVFADAPTYRFGTKSLNSSTDITLSITNHGILSATQLGESSNNPLAAPFTYKGGSFPGTGGTCTTTLPSGGSCNLVVNFTPTVVGAYTQNLTLGFYDGASVVEVSLHLVGGTPAVVGISDGPSLDFGKRAKGSSSSKTLTLTNSGGSTATSLSVASASTLAAPFSFLGGTYPGTGGTCGSSLDPAATCTLVLAYSPTVSTLGTRTKTLTIQYDDGQGNGSANQQVSRTVTGTAQSGWSNGAAASLTARTLASGVWTGSKAIFWGGQQDAATKYNDGAIYDPIADVWSSVAMAGAPVARSRHTAVWADNLSTPVMIIWGGAGAGDTALATGGMYDPGSNSWTAISTTGAPSARYGHSAVWDSVNKKMIVWGGGSTAVASTHFGYVFDPTGPSGGTWTAISDHLSNTPSERYLHSATWTGTQMVIWGGCAAKNANVASCQVGSEVNTGAIYDPTYATWQTLSTTSAPTARSQAALVSDGVNLYVWGGAVDSDGTGSVLTSRASGAIYSSGIWTAISSTSAPTARYGNFGYWTGTSLMIWGGLQGSGEGALLDSGNSWTQMSTSGAPTSNDGAATVHTGSSDLRLIVFGGQGAGPSYSNTIAVYSPE